MKVRSQVLSPFVSLGIAVLVTSAHTARADSTLTRTPTDTPTDAWHAVNTGLPDNAFFVSALAIDPTTPGTCGSGQ